MRHRCQPDHRLAAEGSTFEFVLPWTRRWFPARDSPQVVGALRRLFRAHLQELHRPRRPHLPMVWESPIERCGSGPEQGATVHRAI